MTRKVIQQAPVYQCQLANGNWIDQSKESYDYKNKMGQSVVRVLYATIEQPVSPAYLAEHTWQHIANEWSDMATNGIQQIRNIKDGITTCDKALAGLDGDLKHCREVTAMAQTVPPAAYHGITPRPLDYPLSDYHEAPGSGPLHATWLDKPHRIVYDLVAALANIAQPVEMAVDHDFAIGTATCQSPRPEGWGLKSKDNEPG